MQTAKETERTLLTEIANEVQTDWQNIRWWHVGGETPRAIIVQERGAKGRRLKTISPTSESWQSWQPVLTELLTEKRRHGKKRMSHKKLQTGKI